MISGHANEEHKEPAEESQQRADSGDRQSALLVVFSLAELTSPDTLMTSRANREPLGDTSCSFVLGLCEDVRSARLDGKLVCREKKNDWLEPLVAQLDGGHLTDPRVIRSLKNPNMLQCHIHKKK